MTPSITEVAVILNHESRVIRDKEKLKLIYSAVTVKTSISSLRLRLRRTSKHKHKPATPDVYTGFLSQTKKSIIINGGEADGQCNSGAE